MLHFVEELFPVLIALEELQILLRTCVEDALGVHPVRMAFAKVLSQARPLIRPISSRIEMDISRDMRQVRVITDERRLIYPLK